MRNLYKKMRVHCKHFFVQVGNIELTLGSVNVAFGTANERNFREAKGDNSCLNDP